MDFLKKMNKNVVLVVVAIVAIAITGSLIVADSNDGFSFKGLLGGGKSAQQIGEDAVAYINDSGMSTTEVTLVEAVEESGMIKIKIDIGGSPFNSYVTKDGKFLFPQDPIIMITEEEKKEEVAVAAKELQKNDSPMLEAYVVSECPFGLQMQRAMAEAVKGAPELAQYMKVLYIGEVSSDGSTITAMHGAQEAQENLRQICIREEQGNKFWDYISCQIQVAGSGISCEKSTGIDSGMLSSCISDTSRGIAYAKTDFDLATKYSVTGSPTMILNEASISETSFGGRSADGVKSMVCAGFNSEPSFCSLKLDTVEAATSFSVVYKGANRAPSGTGGPVPSGGLGACAS